jgi:hypothetical protein
MKEVISMKRSLHAEIQNLNQSNIFREILREANVDFQETQVDDETFDFLVEPLSGDDLGNLWWNIIEPKLWNITNDGIKSSSELRKVSIITCQGFHGWDDYLLLHHYLPTEALNGLKKCKK